MLDLLDMMRPLNCAMASLGAFIGGLIAVGLEMQLLFSLPVLLAVLAVFAITGAGNVINDYLDLEADKVNKPDRPIPSGKISKNTALAFALLLFVFGNACAFMLNGLCLTIAIINSGLLILYSYSLQHKILVGNCVVAYLVGSVFLFGAAVFLNVALALILTVLAILANVAREIVKDLEDMEGDKKGFMKKLASKASKASAPIAGRFGITSEGVRMKYAERSMISLAMTSLMLAVVFSALPYYYGILGIGYVIVVAAADVLFVSCIYSLSRDVRRKKGYSRISRRLKIGMLIAMLAFIAGTII